MKKLVLLLVMLLACASCAFAQETDARVVYLTFDDGPKADTPQLLELLEREGVPATFFFVGAKVRAFPEEARMVYERGYPIGCHTVYHSPSTLKAGTLYVKKDFENFVAIMREHVDEAFETDLYRFPGGSTSYRRETRKTVADMGCAWFDWNAMTADTEAGMSAQDIFSRAVRTAGEEEVVILLAHEGIKRTRDMLPELIAYFRDRGYEFRTLATTPEERALLARCPAGMMLPEEEDTEL